MPHDFESGSFHATPPWNGLGTVLDDPPETASEAICAAGLNWTVTKECLESIVPVDGTYRAVGLHDHYAIIRRKVENPLCHSVSDHCPCHRQAKIPEVLN